MKELRHCIVILALSLFTTGCEPNTSSSDDATAGGSSGQENTVGTTDPVTGGPTPKGETTTSSTGTGTTAGTMTEASTSSGGRTDTGSTSGMLTDGASTTGGDEPCGDGLIQEGEQCDNGPDNMPPEVANPKLKECTTSCLMGCGDGIKSEYEECDNGNCGPDEGECSWYCSLNVEKACNADKQHPTEEYCSTDCNRGCPPGGCPNPGNQVSKDLSAL